ncbi:bile acid:sodium symporter [Oceanimonas sp. CHS3-5]|uniref:bile acid:sodium symporter family protein n=1 Tax=Oceanimonas sp. CHS3-5 TaxID=3068186 RepID=UPI00273E0FEB|nr:bile acid:sodium symporter [Oceanimonas sp. CHS3-5]MDP5292221.1 bile acid:sodium symporter [Oceanimonas sp. CHS3-5]
MVEPLINLLLPFMLALMTLVMGMTLEATHFTRLLRRPRPLLLGLALQWLLLPLLAWGLIWLLALPPLVAAALVLITAAPGGATSNLFSFLADGDTALSVSLTALVGLLAPLWMPVVVMLQLGWLGQHNASLALPLGPAMAQLALICIVPVLVGMAVRRRWCAWAKRHQPRLKRTVSLMFLLLLLVLVARHREDLPSLFSLAALAMLLLCTTALTAGYGLARLAGCTETGCRSLAFETGIQNAAIAIVVAYTQLNSGELALMALLYGIVMNIPALLLLGWFRSRQPAAQWREA